MVTRQQLIDYCLTFSGSYEDYPFTRNTASMGVWTVMRHHTNRKGFAFIFERGGFVTINLKCEPMHADLLRSVYPSVIPAYHMNKTHWNTVIIDGSIADEEIFSWIRQSYGLTEPKQKAKKS